LVQSVERGDFVSNPAVFETHLSLKDSSSFRKFVIRGLSEAGLKPAPLVHIYERKDCAVIVTSCASRVTEGLSPDAGGNNELEILEISDAPTN
jgi:hypothetical protein